MQKGKYYKRLGNEERESISRGIGRRSIRAIAMKSIAPPSTVMREIKRNMGKSGYRAFSASRCAAQQHQDAKEKAKWRRRKLVRRYVISDRNVVSREISKG